MGAPAPRGGSRDVLAAEAPFFYPVFVYTAIPPLNTLYSIIVLKNFFRTGLFHPLFFDFQKNRGKNFLWGFLYIDFLAFISRILKNTRDNFIYPDFIYVDFILLRIFHSIQSLYNIHSQSFQKNPLYSIDSPSNGIQAAVLVYSGDGTMARFSE